MTINVPYKEPIATDKGVVSRIWHKWFISLNNSTNSQIIVNPSFPYNIINENAIIFVTTSEAVVINLLPVVNGVRCRVINTDSSTENVYLTPSGTDLLYGVNAADTILPGEARDVDGSEDEGWW